MSLRAFLYACEFLRVQEALSSPERFHVETDPVPAGDIGARNQQAMQALTGMMAGVKR